jgi:2-amino-4-hydroxy-6-hydroxymethyldihydropteridine diphosphokinase
MAKVYLGLGSNIDPEKNLRLGIGELGARFGILELSNVYRSAAVGFDGDDFLNLVAGLESDVSPAQLHAVLMEIHSLAGRMRSASRYSPRTLDIDLLLYDDLVLDEPPIRIPRSDILKYSFVLGPLAEIAPQLRHPETGKLITEHWAEFDKETHPLIATSLPAD